MDKYRRYGCPRSSDTEELQQNLQANLSVAGVSETKYTTDNFVRIKEGPVSSILHKTAQEGLKLPPIIPPDKRAYPLPLHGLVLLTLAQYSRAQLSPELILTIETI